MLIYHDGDFSSEITLSKAVFMHLKARRVKVGDGFSLCDGQGRVAMVVLTKMDREATCLVEEINVHQALKLPRLIVGVTKFPTIEFVLQKATEIGVSEIVLLKCEYTPIPFNQTVFDKKKPRFEKIIISACEQSGAYFKPRLSWLNFSDYVATNGAKCMLHPRAESSVIDKSADLMIGPEGGWSDAELDSNVQQVRLNTGILRADTACLAALLSWQIS
jgi:16S rRNA (uracil1498-N3)-methyltransferase